MRAHTFCGLMMLSAGALAAQLIVRQAPESGRAFDNYVRAAEAKLDWRAHMPFAKPGVAVVISGGEKPTVDAPAAIGRLRMKRGTLSATARRNLQLFAREPMPP